MLLYFRTLSCLHITVQNATLLSYAPRREMVVLILQLAR